MVSPTPDQRKASSAKLAEAIEVYLNEQGYERRGMLGDWVLVGAEVRVDAEGEPDCEYFVALAGGSMLQHHVLGLIAKAEDVLAGDSDG